MSTQIKNIRTQVSGNIQLGDAAYSASTSFPAVGNSVEVGGDVCQLIVNNRTDGYIRISYDGTNTVCVIPPNGTFIDDLASDQLKTRVRLSACWCLVGGNPTTGRIYWSAKIV